MMVALWVCDRGGVDAQSGSILLVLPFHITLCVAILELQNLSFVLMVLEGIDERDGGLHCDKLFNWPSLGRGSRLLGRSEPAGDGAGEAIIRVLHATGKGLIEGVCVEFGVLH